MIGFEAFIGPVLGAIAGRNKDKQNSRNVDATNRMNAAEAQKNREFQVAQVREARNWDAQQLVRSANRSAGDLAQTRRIASAENIAAEKRGQAYAMGAERRSADRAMDTEERGRAYMEADRDEYREYNDPAATRARLEAAGYNAATGIDNSGGYMGAAGAIGSETFGAGASAPSSFAPSSIGAASSGIAPGAFATMMAYQSEGYDIGSAVSQAFSNIQEGKYAQAELDLRTTQLDMENQRIAKLMEQATMRPINPGVYDRGAGRASTMPAPATATGAGPNSSSTAMPYFDEPTTFMDDTGVPRANPENPREIEADAYDWALDGTLFKNVGEIYRRNTNYNRERWDSVRPLWEKVLNKPLTPAAPMARDSRRTGTFDPSLHYGEQRPGW